jgi:hypothetical protein
MQKASFQTKNQALYTVQNKSSFVESMKKGKETDGMKAKEGKKERNKYGVASS